MRNEFFITWMEVYGLLFHQPWLQWWRCSRNLRMLRWSEGHRRSPRISALDSCKAQKTRQDMVGLEGPAYASRTSGGRRKRKLQAIEDIEDEVVTNLVLYLPFSTRAPFWFTISQYSLLNHSASSRVLMQLYQLLCWALFPVICKGPGPRKSITFLIGP